MSTGTNWDLISMRPHCVFFLVRILESGWNILLSFAPIVSAEKTQENVRAFGAVSVPVHTTLFPYLWPHKILLYRVLASPKADSSQHNSLNRLKPTRSAAGGPTFRRGVLSVCDFRSVREDRKEGRRENLG